MPQSAGALIRLDAACGADAEAISVRKHVEAEHHSALVVLGYVAVRHPAAGVRDLEHDVHAFAGADQHGVLPHQVVLLYAVAVEDMAATRALQVERVVLR